MNSNTPTAQDNGVCPHCGRADAVQEKGRIHSGVTTDRSFGCNGCGAMWAGVRKHGKHVIGNRVLGLGVGC